MRARCWRMVSGAVALALVVAGCASGEPGAEDPEQPSTSEPVAADTEGEETAEPVEPSPGITDTEVLLGGSFIFSGPAAAYGALGHVSECYFDMVNDQGGVEMADGNTRTIELEALDDEANPARGVENARRFVERDEVFAVYGTGGTGNNLAIRDYLNGVEVPHLFVYSGASFWGTQHSEFPWTIGFIPTYALEAAVFAEHLKAEMPDATVALLSQDDDFGRDYALAFKKAIEGTDIEIVAEEVYALESASVDGQVGTLANSEADAFLNASSAKFTAQSIRRAAELGWEPLQFISSISASPSGVFEPAGMENAEGVLTASYFKDPSDPQFDDDPEVDAYRSLIEEYCSGQDPNDTQNVIGYLHAQALVAALEQLDTPTRVALMDTVRSFDGVELDMLLDGIAMSTDGFDDPFPIEGLQLQQWQTDRFVPLGDVQNMDGRTIEVAPELDS